MRVVAFASLVTLLALVGSGRFYVWAGEGRTIGLGEEPLWFPHAAAQFSGRPEMPERFLCFHNGHAGMYEYYNGPTRKVYADARLEVMGPEVYGDYVALENRIRGNNAERQQNPNAPDWQDEVRKLGSPGILVDDVHSEMAGTVATLLTAPGWRCVWFDPVASVFVPDSLTSAPPAVDFWARLFRSDPTAEPKDNATRKAAAKSLSNIALKLTLNPSAPKAKSRPMVLLGAAYAREVVQQTPQDFEGWKYLGLLEALREPLGSPEDPVARFRQPFDPVFDLSPARATYALRQALIRNPDDSKCLIMLVSLYQSRGMNEAALPLWEHIGTLYPTNQKRAVSEESRSMAIREGGRLVAKMGEEPSGEWRNMDELDKAVEKRLDTGRAAGAYNLLATAYRPGSRPWEVSDRLASLKLHLGEPAAARKLWEEAHAPKRPGLQQARIAASYLAEENFPAARRAYRKALDLEPRLFEAWYGLAVLERDAGNAQPALEAATTAVQLAPTDVAKQAAAAIAQSAEPYAR